jgi:DNA-binding LytR/AlgR family response regulator
MNCLIVDDDPLTCTLVAEYAKKTNFIKRVDITGNPYEAINMLNSNPPDLLFLDIELPEMDGMQLLQALSDPPATVLITSRTDLALEAYDHGVLDYLVKPIKYTRFFLAAKKAFDYADHVKSADAKDSGTVFAKVNNQLIKLKLDTLLYVEALADYVILHMTGGQQHIVLTTMKGIASKLPENFVRVHRSYIVNSDLIDFIEDSTVVINKKTLPIGNTYRSSLSKNLRMI